MKRPAFQFYPGDWQRDTALRFCSVAARGLWIDMMCLMHEGAPYGHLKVGSKDILPPVLARMVGASLPEVEGWLAELEQAGVFSRTDDGTIYSRRMVRDEEIRQARAAGGVKSLDNPRVPRRKDTHKGYPSTPSLDPSPASASASAKEEPDIPSSLERRTRRQVLTPDEQAVIDHYRAVHPKRLRGAIPDKVLRLLRAALTSYPAADLTRAIDGNAASEFHREHGHLGLELILRNSEKIDYFLDLGAKARTAIREMTDEFGQMRPHRQDEAGKWVPVEGIAA